MRTVRTFLAVLIAVLMAVPQLPVAAQQSALSRVAGVFVASNYNAWQGQIISGNSATGAGAVIVVSPSTPLGDGRSLNQYNVNAPLLIIDAAGETITPTAVALSTCPTDGSVSGGLGPCATITATITSLHGRGAVVKSGTNGVQEAINDAFAAGGGKVVLDRLAGFNTLQTLPTGVTLLNSSGLSNVFIEDVRGGSGTSYWSLQPGLTAIAAPAALTAATITTAITGGTIATAQTPRFCITAVDAFGGETPCSDDSAAGSTLVDGAGSTNSYTITAAGVPAGTGIIGYRLYVSATGGATQTETLAAPAQLTCTAAAQSPLPGTCAAGAAILLTALTATTASGPPLGTAGVATALATAHTTVVNRQGHVPPLMLPFINVAPAGHFPVTVTSATTLAAGFDMMAEMAYPAGFLNSLGKTVRVCMGGVTTPSAATVAGTWLVKVGARPNSGGTQSTATAQTWTFVASTQWTAAASTWETCSDITTTATGASGTVEAHASGFGVVVTATGIDGAGIQTYLPGRSGVSAAVDLTVQGFISLTYVQTAASWTVPQCRYMSIQPVN